METVRGSLFFYPAAGSDYAEPLKVFEDHLDMFWFCDKCYPRGLKLAPVFGVSDGFSLVGAEKSGMPDAIMEKRHDKRGKEYFYLEPSRLSEIYKRPDGRQVCIVRRRGFGQIALTKEFHPRSIGVFMHRGDSRGEGGSNVFFLANKKDSFEPCGHLFDKLGEQLTDSALVITDGSNTSIDWLRCFHNQNMGSAAAYESHRGKNYLFGGFGWSCVGWLSRRYGPTLVWGLRRQANQGNA